MAIKKHLAMFAVYTEEAKASQLEGTVKIKLTISSKGFLEKMEIIESSGQVLLDIAAKLSVSTASPYPPIPKVLGKQFGYTVVLIYKNEHFDDIENL